MSISKENIQQLSDWIRSIRARLGETQQTFADRLCITKRSLQDWESPHSSKKPRGPAILALKQIEREIGESME